MARVSVHSEDVEIQDLEHLRQWVKKLPSQIGAKSIVLLEGPLGVGKTQLVRYFVEELGQQEACSPSFAILNHYETQKGDVDHVDLYRLESDDDLESTGFWDLFSKTDGYIFIEWADRLDMQMLPANWPLTRLVISTPAEGSQERKIQMTQYK